MYTKAFIKIYNWRDYGLVYKTHKMVKLEKYPILRVKNSLNLITHQFYKIFSILWNTYVISRDNKGNIFYVNNYID